MKLKTNQKLTGDIVGLDLGQSRTGVARVNVIAQLPEPLQPIDMSKGTITESVQQILDELNATAVVVGVPRSLDARDTAQTAWSLEVVRRLETDLRIPVFAIDEAGTTKEAELRASSVQSVDSVAACIILENFLDEVRHGRIAHVSF